MHKLTSILVSLLLMGGFFACQTTSVDPTSGTEATYTQNTADIKTYVSTKGLSGTSTSSGLFYALTRANPSGKVPAYGEEIEFNYKLYVLSRNTDGTVITDKLIDTAYASTPTYFPFFTGALKPGLEEGIKLMHEGEQAVMLMPSILAFGDVATTDGSVPANSVVRFDVQLRRSRTETQQIDDYVTANKLAVTELTTTGLRFIKTKTTTDSLTTGKTITVKYSGRLLRATTPFDQGSLDAVLGQNKFVKGFEEGLAKLRVGEKATIIFPSTLGYGTTGVIQNNTYVIPPNAPLVFDLEVISAK